MTAPVVLGEGVLNWPRSERVSDRYGCVNLEISLDSGRYVQWNDAPIGRVGTIMAEITEARRSRHVGDFFRGLFPSIPGVGEIFALGAGRLFADDSSGTPSIGLMPDDGRAEDWLNPAALYACHEQTVRLIFEASDE